MKRLKLNAFLLALFFLFTILLKAQGPPQPPSGGHGTTTNQTPSQGGSAPIGSGMLLLLGMGTVYTAIKTHKAHKSQE
ncbi:MAG TPA: hypothetical protein VK172_08510 [Lentimicrobium sp.]|jgi:hypothetical protein|nr:hypothetical protein [Lentimicrobium sp.]